MKGASQRVKALPKTPAAHSSDYHSKYKYYKEMARQKQAELQDQRAEFLALRKEYDDLAARPPGDGPGDAASAIEEMEATLEAVQQDAKRRIKELKGQ